MIQNTRVRKLNGADRRENGSYVLYWMQEAQRTRSNAALEMAIRGANKHGLPVVVCFGLMDGYPEANARHYAFMLEGLSDCAKNLATRGIAFVVRRGLPVDVAIGMSQDAAAVICDRSYMPLQTGWRERLAREAGCTVVQVETEVVLVDVVSGKSEYAARTIRPKIQRVWDEYLVPLAETRPEASADGIDLAGDIDVSDPAAALAALDLDWSVRPATRFRGERSKRGAGLIISWMRFSTDMLTPVMNRQQRRHPSSAPIFTSAISRRLTWYWPHVTPTQARQTTVARLSKNWSSAGSCR